MGGRACIRGMRIPVSVLVGQIARGTTVEEILADLEIYDEEHSDEEDRFIAVGPIERGLIVVSYTERDARLATKNERRRFDEYRRVGHEG